MEMKMMTNSRGLIGLSAACAVALLGLVAVATDADAQGSAARMNCDRPGGPVCPPSGPPKSDRNAGSVVKSAPAAKKGPNGCGGYHQPACPRKSPNPN
jgi:hypothetical protein